MTSGHAWNCCGSQLLIISSVYLHSQTWNNSGTGHLQLGAWNTAAGVQDFGAGFGGMSAGGHVMGVLSLPVPPAPAGHSPHADFGPVSTAAPLLMVSVDGSLPALVCWFAGSLVCWFAGLLVPALLASVGPTGVLALQQQPGGDAGGLYHAHGGGVAAGYYGVQASGSLHVRTAAGAAGYPDTSFVSPPAVSACMSAYASKVL